MKIEGKILIELRRRNAWSIADLSSKAKGVSEATIMRIENNQTMRHNKSTIERLARALKTDQETLSGEKNLADFRESTRDSSSSQLRIRLSNEARNSLVFVGQRYRVKLEHILEVAPLLFHLVAGESLQKRSRALEEIEQRRAALETAGSQVSHISGRLTSDWQADNLAGLEEASIANNDLFGLAIDDDESVDDPRCYNYDHAGENPFARFLKDKTEELNKLSGWQGAIEAIDEDYMAGYSICRPEVEAFCEGDERAAELLIDGIIGLHEIPNELRAHTCTSDRNSWIKQTADSKLPELSELLLELDL